MYIDTHIHISNNSIIPLMEETFFVLSKLKDVYSWEGKL